ncbi:hypothetical protein M0R04_14400 [Candidatus Dojkabacteria bacterium]|jgi:hypothetical protein|nr:hypothetical protein [Candidatus Dojkabacteria bacterium]
MAKYRVGFYYDQTGYTTIEAKTAEEAEKKVYNILAEDGIEALENFNCQDRDYNTTSNEIKEVEV